MMKAGHPAKKIARAVAGLALTVAIGGFASAALVRYSPGFDVDENSWNSAISKETAAAILARRANENALPSFYLRYLSAAAHGDFGISDSFHAPVSQLLSRRAPVTLGLLAWSVGGGMLLGCGLAWVAVWRRRGLLESGTAALSGLLLAIPPAVLALAFFLWRAPVGVAAAVAILPRTFGPARAIWSSIYDSEALIAARSRGVGVFELVRSYVLGPAMLRLVALAGVNTVVAFGLLIPIEAICDVPGIGQLMWKGATARDLPVLCGLALICTGIVALFAAAGEFIAIREEQA